MPMTWNEKTDAKLLVAILHTTNAKLDYNALAEYMGPECTDIAVKIRIQRLRKQVNDATNSLGPGTGPVAAAGDAGEGSSAPASPEKRKKGGNPGVAKAKEPKNGEVKKSPSKKVKKEGVKVEDDAGDAENGV